MRLETMYKKNNEVNVSCQTMGYSPNCIQNEITNLKCLCFFSLKRLK